MREPTSWSYCSVIQRLVAAVRVAQLCRGRRLPGVRLRLLDLVARALVGEERRGDRADDLAVDERAQLAVVGHLADRRAVELPARAHVAHRVEHLRPDDGDHALLRLGDHDLPRLHALFAERHAVERDVDAGTVARHLRERRGEPGSAAVLQRLDEPGLDELDRDLDQLLARERVADLHRRPLVGIVLAELLAREHRRAADPVASRRRAVEDDEIAGPLRLRRLQARRIDDPDAHRVDEAVARVRLVEDRRAADVRDADGVAVPADAGDRALEGMVGRAEPEPVEKRDRPRAHRDDVAQDPADSRRGALERLDRGRVVVRLDLEGHRDAVAEVEHAGVLAWPLQDALALRRQPLEQRRRVLVAAVLGPEEREDRELEVVRIAAQELLDSVRLPVGETEGPMERLFRDLRQVIQCIRGNRRPPRCVTKGCEPPAPGHAARPRTALGSVVHVHQSRGARADAGDADHGPARARRDHAGGARAVRRRHA